MRLGRIRELLSSGPQVWQLTRLRRLLQWTETCEGIVRGFPYHQTQLTDPSSSSGTRLAGFIQSSNPLSTSPNCIALDFTSPPRSPLSHTMPQDEPPGCGCPMASGRVRTWSSSMRIWSGLTTTCSRRGIRQLKPRSRRRQRSKEGMPGRRAISWTRSWLGNYWISRTRRSHGLSRLVDR